MATYRDVVTQSLRLMGAQALGDSAPADETANALFQLNALLGQWRNDDLLSYGIAEIDSAFVSNQSVYEIGPTASDIVTTRPMEVKQIVFKYASIWTPIKKLDSPEDWNRFCRLDTLSVPYPMYFRYLSDVPNGTIEFYPKPSSTSPFKVVVEQVIPQEVTLNDAVSVPPGYMNAFVWSLAELLCPYYGETSRLGYIASKAKEFLDQIKAQNFKVGLLQNDPGIVNRDQRNSGYGQISYMAGL